MKIEKDRFWDMLENTAYCDYKFNSLYLEVLAENLTKATGIYFTADAHSIVSNSLNFRINERDFSTYDDLVKKIEEYLGTGDERADKELLNKFKWVADWFWYFAGKGCLWAGDFTTNSNASKAGVFEVLYYAISGDYHKDLAFANDLGHKYLVSEKYGAFFGKVVIPELDNIEVTFQKNGNIKVKGMSETEWKRLDHLFTLIGNKRNK